MELVKKKNCIVTNEFVIGFTHIVLNTWQKLVCHYGFAWTTIAVDKIHLWEFDTGNIQEV